MMSAHDFVRWMSGFIEGRPKNIPTSEQWSKIVDMVRKLNTCDVQVTEKLFHEKQSDPFIGMPLPM